MQSLELSSSVFSSTSSYASSSLFEHGSSADSHTDSSPPIPDLPESKGTPSAGRVAYFAHPISRRRDRKPYVFLEEDLGYDAESEDLPTRRPSTSRSCVKRRVSSGQARRASRRKASDIVRPSYSQFSPNLTTITAQCISCRTGLRSSFRLLLLRRCYHRFSVPAEASSDGDSFI